jgi:hypothetical protein
VRQRVTQVGKACGKEGPRRGNPVAKRDHRTQNSTEEQRDQFEATKQSNLP